MGGMLHAKLLLLCLCCTGVLSAQPALSAAIPDPTAQNNGNGLRTPPASFAAARTQSNAECYSCDLAMDRTQCLGDCSTCSVSYSGTSVTVSKPLMCPGRVPSCVDSCYSCVNGSERMWECSSSATCVDNCYSCSGLPKSCDHTGSCVEHCTSCNNGIGENKYFYEYANTCYKSNSEHRITACKDGLNTYQKMLLNGQGICTFVHTISIFYLTKMSSSTSMAYRVLIKERVVETAVILGGFLNSLIAWTRSHTMIMQENCNMASVQSLTSVAGGWSSRLFEDPAFVSAFVLLVGFIFTFAYYSYTTMMARSDVHRHKVLDIFIRELRLDGQFELLCPNWRAKGEELMLKHARLQQAKEAKAQKHLRNLRKTTKFAAKFAKNAKINGIDGDFDDEGYSYRTSELRESDASFLTEHQLAMVSLKHDYDVLKEKTDRVEQHACLADPDKWKWDGLFRRAFLMDLMPYALRDQAQKAYLTYFGADDAVKFNLLYTSFLFTFTWAVAYTNLYPRTKRFDTKISIVVCVFFWSMAVITFVGALNTARWVSQYNITKGHRALCTKYTKRKKSWAKTKWFFSSEEAASATSVCDMWEKCLQCGEAGDPACGKNIGAVTTREAVCWVFVAQQHIDEYNKITKPPVNIALENRLKALYKRTSHWWGNVSKPVMRQEDDDVGAEDERIMDNLKLPDADPLEWANYPDKNATKDGNADLTDEIDEGLRIRVKRYFNPAVMGLLAAAKFGLNEEVAAQHFARNDPRQEVHDAGEKRSVWYKVRKMQETQDLVTQGGDKPTQGGDARKPISA